MVKLVNKKIKLNFIILRLLRYLILMIMKQKNSNY